MENKIRWKTKDEQEDVETWRCGDAAWGKDTGSNLPEVSEPSDRPWRRFSLLQTLSHTNNAAV